MDFFEIFLGNSSYTSIPIFRITVNSLFFVSDKMKILSWNVHGFGNKYTRKHLGDLIRANDPDIIFLCETKTMNMKMERWTHSFNYMNHLYFNPIGASGGLFMHWKDVIHIDLVDMNFSFIFMLVNVDSRSGHTLLNCMYGALDEQNWDKQWNYLDSLVARYNYPWIILGDLNFIIRQEEKVGGNQISQRFLKIHLNILGVFDLNFMGNPFTWSKHRSGDSLILERLDRALVNALWFDFFPNAIVYHLVCVASDHAPILLVTSKEDNGSRIPLRFNRCWLSNTCKDVITENWRTSENGSKADRHSRCLTNVKVALRQWNLISFGNFQSQINDIQRQLEDISSNMLDPSSVGLKASLEESLKYWYNVRQDYYMQRAKENVLTFDDKNTKYFHDKVNFRKKVNPN